MKKDSYRLWRVPFATGGVSTERIYSHETLTTV